MRAAAPSLILALPVGGVNDGQVHPFVRHKNREFAKTARPQRGFSPLEGDEIQ